MPSYTNWRPKNYIYYFIYSARNNIYIRTRASDSFKDYCKRNKIWQQVCFIVLKLYYFIIIKDIYFNIKIKSYIYFKLN